MAPLKLTDYTDLDHLLALAASPLTKIDSAEFYI
jgi:hypothetical protein